VLLNQTSTKTFQIDFDEALNKNNVTTITTLSSKILKKSY